MRLFLFCTALVSFASCQSYADLKARYFPPDTPWTHLTAENPIADPLSGPCRIPLHEDNYYGFAIGFPNGWHIDYTTGALLVAKDETQMVGALVFPARMRRTDVPPEQLATSFTDSLARNIRNGGGAFALIDKITDGVTASATVTATIGGVPMRGLLQVIEKPGFATLKLYWAPQAELMQDEPTLQQVVSCFKRKTVITSKQPVAPPGGPTTRVGRGAPIAAAAPAAVQALHPYHGRFYNVQIPAGWIVKDETDHGIDITSADGTAAFGFGWIIGAVMRPDAAVVRGINQIYPGVQITQSGFPPAPQGWQVAAAEFEGVTHNVPTHGFSRVAMGQGVSLSTGWSMTPAKWAQLNPTMQAMAATVQILPAAASQAQVGIRQQLASYPPIRPSTPTSADRKPASSSVSGWDDGEATKERLQQGWSDSMLGQDRAVSPTTGETYVVPTNAWSDTGPQGAGYYRAVPGGGAERLNVLDNSGNAE